MSLKQDVRRMGMRVLCPLPPPFPHPLAIGPEKDFHHDIRRRVAFWQWGHLQHPYESLLAWQDNTGRSITKTDHNSYFQHSPDKPKAQSLDHTLKLDTNLTVDSVMPSIQKDREIVVYAIYLFTIYSLGSIKLFLANTE